MFRDSAIHNSPIISNLVIYSFFRIFAPLKNNLPYHYEIR